jgi:hypothetical protein
LRSAREPFGVGVSDEGEPHVVRFGRRIARGDVGVRQLPRRGEEHQTFDVVTQVAIKRSELDRCVPPQSRRRLRGRRGGRRFALFVAVGEDDVDRFLVRVCVCPPEAGAFAFTVDEHRHGFVVAAATDDVNPVPVGVHNDLERRFAVGAGRLDDELARCCTVRHGEPAQRGVGDRSPKVQRRGRVALLQHVVRNQEFAGKQRRVRNLDAIIVLANQAGGERELPRRIAKDTVDVLRQVCVSCVAAMSTESQALTEDDAVREFEGRSIA